MSIPLKLLGEAALCLEGRVGTGGVETITHDLGQTPKLIMVVVRDSGAATYLLGPKNGTTLDVTVTNTQVYDLLAWVDE